MVLRHREWVCVGSMLISNALHDVWLKTAGLGFFFAPEARTLCNAEAEEEGAIERGAWRVGGNFAGASAAPGARDCGEEREAARRFLDGGGGGGGGRVAIQSLSPGFYSLQRRRPPGGVPAACVECEFEAGGFRAAALHNHGVRPPCAGHHMLY